MWEPSGFFCIRSFFKISSIPSIRLVHYLFTPFCWCFDKNWYGENRSLICCFLNIVCYLLFVDGRWLKTINWLLAVIIGIYCCPIRKQFPESLSLSLFLYHDLSWTLSKRISGLIFLGSHPSWSSRDVIAYMTAHTSLVGVVP